MCNGNPIHHADTRTQRTLCYLLHPFNLTHKSTLPASSNSKQYGLSPSPPPCTLNRRCQHPAHVISFSSLYTNLQAALRSATVIPRTSTLSHKCKSKSSLKITAQAAAAEAPPALPFRVGHGWDLHRLEPGYPLIIGGIDIPHERGCVAHSDGDVLLHTVVDAILGALSLPDIGQLFPDNDPKWKGARSDIFLKEAVRLMNEAGYHIGNIDCTIIAQRPKLSPHKEAIRENLCGMLNAHPSVVNIKAKTHEKVDSLGENRSIACHAVVMLLKN